MTTRSRSLDALVAQLDPVPGHRLPALDRRARADLDAVLATGPAPVAVPAHPRARRLRLLPAPVAVALAAALALVLVVLWPSAGPASRVLGGGGQAFAATPPPLQYRPLPGAPSARTLLEQIAARTAALPADTGTGRYAHLVTDGWSLWTTVDGKRVTSEVVPQSGESWTAEDGSGRVVETTEEPGERPRREDTRYGPGEQYADPALRSLSADDDELRRQLEVGHPVANGPAERLVAVEDTVRAVPLQPAVRAALLRYLAATRGLSVTGAVTDRAGREGIAFSLDSDYSGLPTRYTVVVDPGDGRVLASEDTLTTTAGQLDVPIPSVIGYEVHLSADYSDRLD